MQGKRNKTIISRITENRNFGLLLGLAVLLIIAAIVTPSMYSLNSILSMLQNNAVFGLLALGEMVVIITAGIDISIGASLSLAGVVCCRFMAENTRNSCNFFNRKRLISFCKLMWKPPFSITQK